METMEPNAAAPHGGTRDDSPVPLTPAELKAALARLPVKQQSLGTRLGGLIANLFSWYKY